MTRMDFVREWIWTQFADPSASFALLLLGATGIVWECAAPGWIAPGVAGLVLAALAAAALPKLASAWFLLAAGALLLALATRAGKVWLGAAWGAVLFTAAGLRWTVSLPLAVISSVTFAVFAALLWRISFKAIANKQLK